MQVKVDFYGEALCPYCARFLADVAAPLFAQGFSPYMDFRYVFALSIMQATSVCPHLKA